MLKSKYTKYLASFLISWLGLCFIFPHISGITYTGGIFEGLGLTVLNLVIFVALVVIGFIAIAIGSIIYMVRKDAPKLSKSVVSAWMLKLGFWKLTIGGSVIGILLSSLTWKITASLSSSLEINGWLPIIIGTTITSLIAFVPKYLSRPSDFTEAHFRAELSTTLAKEQAEEAADQGPKDGETK